MSLYIEIGINHFGKSKYLTRYINLLKGMGADGISIQILNKNKVGDKLKKFCLNKKKIKYFVKKAKKNFKYVGVGIHSWDDFEFLKKLNLDFIKILGSSFGDKKYFLNIKKTGVKKIFISSLGKNKNQIIDFLKKITKLYITLIFTFSKTQNYYNEIKKISYFKKKLNLNVAYGNHYNDISLIPKVLKYDPTDIFFYVKMNKKLKYPDNAHAVPINKVKNLIDKLK